MNTRVYTVGTCETCGHLANWHRFHHHISDDDRPLTDWHQRPFRCVGPEFDGCDDQCPDFTGTPLTWIEENADEPDESDTAGPAQAHRPEQETAGSGTVPTPHPDATPATTGATPTASGPV